jgi:hypothetical protein
MLDLGTVLSILSILITAILATHITFSSNCFGFRTSIESSEGKLHVDIDIGNEEIQAVIDEKSGEIFVEIVPDT